jgi:hypothetical protein
MTTTAVVMRTKTGGGDHAVARGRERSRRGDRIWSGGAAPRTNDEGGRRRRRRRRGGNGRGIPTIVVVVAAAIGRLPRATAATPIATRAMPATTMAGGSDDRTTMRTIWKS